MTESFNVYVGNLSASVSEKKLQDLFSQVGEVLSVWINRLYERITYGFIKFKNLPDAKQAIERFNDVELDFFRIKVKMSTQTELGISKTEKRSILLELPKNKGETKSHKLKKILSKNLRQNKEIAKDFATACKEAEDITLPKQLQMIKTAPEQSDLSSLEETIIRNFKTPRQKNAVPVDFDLSKDKLMTTDEYDKHFNVILTKPRFLVPEKQKQTIPFELDYRSVCE